MLDISILHFMITNNKHISTSIQTKVEMFHLMDGRTLNSTQGDESEDDV